MELKTKFQKIINNKYNQIKVNKNYKNNNSPNSFPYNPNYLINMSKINLFSKAALRFRMLIIKLFIKFIK